MLILIPILHFGARDQDCFLVKRTGSLSGLKLFFTMDVEQKANDVRLEADRQRLDYSTNHVYLHRFSRLRFCVCV